MAGSRENWTGTWERLGSSLLGPCGSRNTAWPQNSKIAVAPAYMCGHTLLVRRIAPKEWVEHEVFYQI
jgi:hypothetical protein